MAEVPIISGTQDSAKQHSRTPTVVGYGKHALKVLHIADAPLPPPKQRGAMARQFCDLLLSMQVGDCIEVNRVNRSVGYYLQRFREKYGPERRYTVRTMGAKDVCRVWRTK